MGEKKHSTVRQVVASSAVVAAVAAMSATLVVVEPSGVAFASPECRDVFVLAVPGTWETNAKADPNKVPGMLSKVTQPLKHAVTSGTAITGPSTIPVQIGQEKPSQGAQALGTLAGGLLDTAASKLPSTSPSVPQSGSAPTDLPTLPSGIPTELPSTSPETSTPAPSANPQPANWTPQRPSIQRVDSTSPSQAPTDGGAVGKSVAFEQVPYVAQVGGPVAGFLKNNPLTLGESRENGVKALKSRLSEISSECPSSDVAILGYSQGALVAGDVLSAIGNGSGPISASRIIGAGLLSDPARTPTTANLDTETAPALPQVLPGAETLVGPNVPGQGVVGARPAGFGQLADRVTSFCAEGDAICSLTGKSPAIAAVVPLLNLKKEDIGPYVTARATTLLTNIATTPPEDMQAAITSVMTAATQLTAAGATNPAALPLELARIVFASSTLDDIGKVVRMPEYDAFLSLTKPDQLVTQAVDIANYSLLGVHQAYDRRPVNAQGDTATVFLAKWLLGRIESST